MVQFAKLDHDEVHELFDRALSQSKCILDDMVNDPVMTRVLAFNSDKSKADAFMFLLHIMGLGVVLGLKTATGMPVANLSWETLKGEVSDNFKPGPEDAP